MFKKILVPALVTFTVSFAGCSFIKQDTTSVEPNNPLLGEWQIEDINGEGIIDSSHLTITFDDKGQVYGNATCNRYGSSYELTGKDKDLSFGHSLVTKMACPEALMNQEQKFLETFNQISQFEINENGALILKSNNGKTLRGYLLGQ